MISDWAELREATYRGLETLERNASALTQIVEDVLDISRIASGKIRLNVQTVDPGAVLRDALSTITPGAVSAVRARRVRPSAWVTSEPRVAAATCLLMA